MRYYVTRKEVYDAIVCVEADNKKDALKKAADDNLVKEVALEYNHTLDPDYWSVEEAPNE